MLHRPRSIAIFEVAYLAALATILIGPMLMWPVLTASIAEQARVGPSGAGAVNGVLIGGMLIIAALGLALWWFVARRRSNVARWIAVVLLGYSLVSSALGVAEFGALDVVRGLTLLGMVFTAVAIAALFMPDARAWFADKREVLS